MSQTSIQNKGRRILNTDCKVILVTQTLRADLLCLRLDQSSISISSLNEMVEVRSSPLLKFKLVGFSEKAGTILLHFVFWPSPTKRILPGHSLRL